MQPQLPVWVGLDAVRRWASLTRIHQSGEATCDSYPDQVTAVVLTASMFWARPCEGQVLGPCDGQCREDTGLPRA